MVGSSDSVPPVGMAIRNQNSGAQYVFVSHSKVILKTFPALDLPIRFVREFLCRENHPVFFRCRSRVILVDFSSSLGNHLWSLAVSTRKFTGNESVINARLGSPFEDAKFWESWSA